MSPNPYFWSAQEAIVTSSKNSSIQSVASNPFAALTARYTSTFKMKEMRFIPDGERRLQKSDGYQKETVRINEQIEELKVQVKQATPLEKREIEHRIKKLVDERKALCPRSALW